MAGMATVADSSLRALSTDVKLNHHNQNSRLLETKQANILPTSSSSKTPPPFSSDILEGYQSCDDFKSDLVAFLTLSGENFIESQKNYTCYYNDTITYYNSSIAIPYSQGTRRAQKKETSYGTNNQVTNVQEKELIQSDGKYIYAASGDRILVSNLNGKVVANVTIPSPPLTSVNQSSYVALDSIFINNNILTTLASMGVCDFDFYCNSTYSVSYYNFNQKTKKLTLVKQHDISSLFSPFDARQIGDHTYLLASAYFGDLYGPLSRCNETFNDLSAEEYEVAALAYLNSNVNQYASEIVAKLAKEGATSTCNNIIKMFNETIQQYDVSCTITKVFSLGLRSTSKKAYFYPFSSYTSHIGKDAMLVSTQGNFGDTTFLLKFSLQGQVITPTSVGTIVGSILSQYDIDQYNGYYRIASSSYSTSEATYEAQITVLQEQNSQLKVVGSVTVGAGAMLSSRFYKEKAFLVTTEWSGVYYNESTTTMSLLNLTSPTNPSIAATEIITYPLYNFYLMYPIEDGKYIISIDNFVSKVNASGITVYLFKATNNSLKQVGEPSEVIMAEKVNGELTWVSSDAMWDAHAFRYLSQSRKLIIPVTVYEYSYYNVTTDVNDENFQGFFVYDVDLAKGVKHVGNVTHDVANCYYYPSRSMVFNGDLITVMGSTIKRTSSVTSPSNLKWELENYCGLS
jgi:uncharacterized secreted protein with C-terminal beta-propeller domain